MPANLVPNDAIATLAEKIDSPALLTILRRLKENGFLMNDNDMSQETASILGRLTEMGLVDPGFDEPTNGRPFIWVRNSNGDRVLKYFEEISMPALKIHSRARPALDFLSEVDRDSVLGTVYYLRSRDPATWPHELAVPFGSGKPVYLLRVTPELRAIVTVLDSGDIELTDIVREETLRLFRGRQRDTAAHP